MIPLSAYTIDPANNVTDYEGPAGCLCKKNANTCLTCDPLTNLKNGACNCEFNYNLTINNDNNTMTVSIENVELSDMLALDQSTI